MKLYDRNYSWYGPQPGKRIFRGIRSKIIERTVWPRNGLETGFLARKFKKVFRLKGLLTT